MDFDEDEAVKDASPKDETGGNSKQGSKSTGGGASEKKLDVSTP